MLIKSIMRFTRQVDNLSAFDVSRVGTAGVTADAKVTLKVNENTPSNLYYKLSPIDVSDNLTENKEIVNDEDVILNNNISTIEKVSTVENLKLSRLDLQLLHMIYESCT